MRMLKDHRELCAMVSAVGFLKQKNHKVICMLVEFQINL